MGGGMGGWWREREMNKRMDGWTHIDFNNCVVSVPSKPQRRPSSDSQGKVER
jgi:hypothetical protein